ncbi:MAG: hypothetical protein ACRBBR_00725 [Cellvibrionaceae bacterium]
MDWVYLLCGISVIFSVLVLAVFVWRGYFLQVSIGERMQRDFERREIIYCKTCGYNVWAKCADELGCIRGEEVAG